MMEQKPNKRSATFKDIRGNARIEWCVDENQQFYGDVLIYYNPIVETDDIKKCKAEIPNQTIHQLNRSKPSFNGIPIETLIKAAKFIIEQDTKPTLDTEIVQI